MIPVRSRAIRKIGYEPDIMRLKITFKQGRTYDFCRVPQEVFERFINSRSKGTFYNRYIEGKYHC